MDPEETAALAAELTEQLAYERARAERAGA
jgi:hypothetical protein